MAVVSGRQVFLACAAWACLLGAAPDAVFREAVEAFRAADRDLAWVAASARDDALRDELAAVIRSLACARLDWKAFAESGGGQPGYTPAALSDAPAPEALRETLRLLEHARRAFFEGTGHHLWDSLFFMETRGLLWRLLGDRLLRDADARALADLEAARRDGDPGRAVLALYRLRRFNEVVALAAALPSASEIGAEKAAEVLVALRGALEFLGRRELAADVAEALLRLGDKAEEVGRPLLAQRTFFIGPRSELAAAATLLAAIESAWDVQGRARSVLQCTAGSFALAAGDSEFALPLLRRAREANRGGYLGAWSDAACGMCLESLGYYGEAADAFDAARREAAAHGHHAFARDQLVNHASALCAANRFAQAEAVLGAALDQALSVRDELWIRLLLGNVKYARRAEGEWYLQDAETIYRRALDRLATVTEAWERREYLEALLWLNTGNCVRQRAMAAGDPALLREAAAYARKAFEKAPREDRVSAIAGANLAEVLLELGDRSGAERYARWALEASQAFGYAEVRWRAHLYLGRLHEQAGALAAAKAEYGQAVEIVESYRRRQGSEAERTSFLHDKTHVYEALVRVHLAAGEVEEAFIVAERARARAALELLGLRELVKALGARDEQVVALARLLRRAKTPPQVAERGAPFASPVALEDVLRARRELEARASHAAGPAMAYLFGAAPGMEQVRGALAEGEALLEYFSVGDALVVWRVDAGGVTVRTCPGAWRDLRAQARAFVAGRASDTALADALGAALLPPEKDLPARMLIVPTDVLHRVPFEALRVGGRYLLDAVEVRYAPSAAVHTLSAARAPRHARGPLLALADPDTDYTGDGRPAKVALPFARREVAAISAGWSGSATTLEGKEATEAAWRRHAPGASVVHLACHGVFKGHDPWGSMLYLAGGDGEDGMLTAWEVLGMDLTGAALITLSGCETGVGRVEPGDDVVGLPRGFMLAGARALVASFWPVRDEATARLMEEFYGHIAAGRAQADALREAKRALRADSRFDSPRDWAAFVLFGGDTPLAAVSRAGEMPGPDGARPPAVKEGTL